MITYTLYDMQDRVIKSSFSFGEICSQDFDEGYIVGIDEENPQNNVVVTNDYDATWYYIHGTQRQSS